MKKIKDITIQMTFKVGFGDLEVSDSVYNGLEKIVDKGTIYDSEANMTKDKEIIDAWEWLNRNVDSGDAYSCEYEINDLEV